MSVDTVRLPGCKIELHGGVTIKRSVTLAGVPGTEIVVQGNPILIKPGGTTSEPIVTLVRIVECTVVLRGDDIDSSSEPLTLFEVDSKASLELQDCQLKVYGSEATPTSALKSAASTSRKTLGVCIREINLAESAGPTATAPRLLPLGSVNLTSCSFFGFMFPVICECPAQLSLSKSSFIKSLGRCITALDPIKLLVEDCSFESIGDTAVNVRFEPVVAGVTVSDAEPRKIIRVAHNVVADSKGYAISLAAVKTLTNVLGYEVMICENQIQSPKKDALHFMDLKLLKLQIINNTVIDAGGNGITVLGSMCGTLVLSHNTLQQCAGCGIFIADSSCKISACECSFNKGNGVSIIGNPLSGKCDSKKTIEVSECMIRNNKQHGISIQDFCNGTVTILKCAIESNHENGVSATCADPYASLVSLSQSMSISTVAPAPLSESTVVVSHGEIKYNRGSGIYLSQQFLMIDGGTFIKNNAQFAIHLLTKGDEKYLRLGKEAKEKATIDGIVGGKWGNSDIVAGNVLCCCCCVKLCRII